MSEWVFVCVRLWVSAEKVIETTHREVGALDGLFLCVCIHTHTHTPASVSAKSSTLLVGRWDTNLLLFHLCRQCGEKQLIRAWSTFGKWQHSMLCVSGVWSHVCKYVCVCLPLSFSPLVFTSSACVCTLLSSIPLSHFPLVSSLITSNLSRPGEKSIYLFS